MAVLDFLETDVDVSLLKSSDYAGFAVDAPAAPYYWPKLTEVVFKVSTPVQVAVKIKLPHLMVPSRWPRAEVRRLEDDKWRKVDTSLNDDVLSFLVAGSGIYALFVNEFAYSRFTEYMAALLPSWMAIRKDRQSIGQQFLNHFGLEFEEIQDYLDYCLDNLFITTADVDQIDAVYKAPLPLGAEPGSYLAVWGDGHPVELFDGLEDFYRAVGDAGIVDFERRCIYTRQFYDDFRISILGAEHKLTLEPHHVWNVFDEFGLFLGLTRWPGEKNVDFKERILDVFRYPPNATRLGLCHAIARDLGLVRRVVWENDSQELIIRDINIVPETVLVDGMPALVEVVD